MSKYNMEYCLITTLIIFTVNTSVHWNCHSDRQTSTSLPQKERNGKTASKWQKIERVTIAAVSGSSASNVVCTVQ
jgi:hypothetical protein